MQKIGEELFRREADVALTNQSGQNLIDNVLDDPFVTEEQLCELNMQHEMLKKHLAVQHARLASAGQSATEFDSRYVEASAWLKGAVQRVTAMQRASSGRRWSQSQLENVERQNSQLEVGISSRVLLHFNPPPPHASCYMVGLKEV